MTTPSNPDLLQVRALFESWRATRPHKEPIPNALWSATLSLLDRYPINEICRELRLSGQQLRERRERSRMDPAAPTFLELTARDLTTMQNPVSPDGSTSPPETETLTAVIERRDGGKLSLTLAVSHLPTVIASFVRA